MEETTRAGDPYGSWKSPITAASVAGGSVGLDQIAVDGSEVTWIERRPEEGGRQVIVRLSSDGQRRDVTPAPLSARTRIHEYGGQSYAVGDGVLVFSNLADGRLYVQERCATPRAITPEGPFRYGDPIITDGGSKVICVREDYGTAAARPGYATRARESATTGGKREPIDAIVSINLDEDSSLVARHNESGAINPLSMTAAKFADDPHNARQRHGRTQKESPSLARDDRSLGVQVLVSGSDFYGAPRLSPDGRHLAWLAWNHPNMPWDGTELWLGDILADGAVGNRRLVAGGPDESVFQPEWSPDGMLYFVSDRSGWWNLYRLRQDRVETLHRMEAEFGLPGWVLGLRTYDFAGPERIVCAFCEEGSWRLGLLDTGSLVFESIPLPFTHISGIRAGDGYVCFAASSPVESAGIVRLEMETRATEVLRRSVARLPDPELISTPQAIEYPTERGLTAHVLFYPPCNPDYAAPPGERPPLLVMCHGGPTDAVSPSLSLGIQFWTSRGFAVAQVNYGGSTGYGRVYRERLNGQWGVVDVEDCANAARYLVAQGLADGDRMAIHGGSAGGLTALRALTLHNLFRAGAIYYGVSDLEMLAHDTPKFESRYHLRLVGPYPERQNLYRARSPVYSAEQITAALIFFQGLEDAVVLPQQSESMVRAARAKGLPVAYVAFEGEGHGFRRAETIRRALEAELFFYSRIFGFELAEPIDPVTIENL
jgi:dipeptidyl aminopeptidase/acylaminoacyl peptidase